MQAKLKKQYLMMIIPAASLFLVFGSAKELGFFQPGQFALPSLLHSVVFFLAAVAALAAPLFLRTLFAYSMRGEKQVSFQEFLSFQQRILWVSQIAPYFSFIAYFCDFPKFYAAGIMLMALYAVYYHCPSQKRITFDQKIFRVK